MDSMLPPAPFSGPSYELEWLVVGWTLSRLVAWRFKTWRLRRLERRVRRRRARTPSSPQVVADSRLSRPGMASVGALTAEPRWTSARCARPSSALYILVGLRWLRDGTLAWLVGFHMAGLEWALALTVMPSGSRIHFWRRPLTARGLRQPGAVSGVPSPPGRWGSTRSIGRPTRDEPHRSSRVSPWPITQYYHTSTFYHTFYVL
jgi:hypothetical protein